MRTYLDAAPIIYVVERTPRFAPVVLARLSVPGTTLVASDLTRMECRVRSLREGNTKRLAEYDQFFNEVLAEMVTLSREVIDRATEIRAQYGFKTPDAIHLAAALVSGCDVFLTNDRRLDRFRGIQVEIVESTQERGSGGA